KKSGPRGRIAYEARDVRLSILAAATVPTCRIRLCRPVTGTFIDDLADGAGHTFFEQMVLQHKISHDLLLNPHGSPIRASNACNKADQAFYT
ncbi:hypothetical protein, partial [Methylobacterium sp. WL2]|uniref:hypothetical protein n=1 Tax=Methylobacterium sp. WL2 TaxID=2603902 RepID=UPI001AEDB47A